MKEIVPLLFLFIFPLIAAAQTKNFLWTEYSFSDTRSVSSDEVALSAWLSRKTERNNGSVGVQFADEQITFDVNGIFLMKKWEHLSVSAEGISSIEKYSDISFRTNNFAGILFHWDFKENFYAGTDVLCGIKTSTFFDLDLDTVWKFDTMLGFYAGWNNHNGRDVSLFIGSRDHFFYPNFGYIIYSLSYCYEVDSQLTMRSSIFVRGIDMMTVSSYVDGWGMKFSMGFRL